MLIILSIMSLSMVVSHGSITSYSSTSVPVGKHVGIYIAADQTNGAGVDKLPTAQDFVNAYFYPANEPRVFSTLMLYVPIYDSASTSRTLQIASLVDNNPNIKMAIEFGFDVSNSTDWTIAKSFMSQLATHPSIGWVGIEGEHSTYGGCEFSSSCNSIGSAWNKGILSSSQLENYFSQFTTDASNAGLAVINYYVTFGPSTWSAVQPQVEVVQFGVCDANQNSYGSQGPCSNPTTAASNELTLGTGSGFHGISGGLSTTAYDAWNPTVMGSSSYNTGLDNYINLYIKYASQYSDSNRQLVLFETGGYQYTDDWYRSIFMNDLANAMTQYPSDWILPSGSSATSTSSITTSTTTSSTTTSTRTTSTTTVTTQLKSTTTSTAKSTSSSYPTLSSSTTLASSSSSSDPTCSTSNSNPSVGDWLTISCSGFPSSSSIEAAIFNNSTGSYAAYLYPSGTSTSGTLTFSMQVTSMMAGTNTAFMYSPTIANIPLSATEFSTNASTTTSSTTSPSMTSTTTTSSAVPPSSYISTTNTYTAVSPTTENSTATTTNPSNITTSSSSETTTDSSRVSSASDITTYTASSSTTRTDGQANREDTTNHEQSYARGTTVTSSSSSFERGLSFLSPSLFSTISSAQNPPLVFAFAVYEITLGGGLAVILQKEQMKIKNEITGWHAWKSLVNQAKKFGKLVTGRLRIG